MTLTIGPNQESFGVICRRVLASSGGRSDRNELARQVLAELGEDGYMTVTWSTYVNSVVNECRKRDVTGLPMAQSFDGQVIQRQLWGPEEYQRSVRDRRQTIVAESALIKKLRAECKARFGVELTHAGEIAA